MWPISQVPFGLCLLLLCHQSGATSWHLSAFWSRPKWSLANFGQFRPILVSEIILQWKPTRAQREKKKPFCFQTGQNFQENALVKERFTPYSKGGSLVSRQRVWFALAEWLQDPWQGCGNGSASEHCRRLPWTCLQESQFCPSGFFPRRLLPLWEVLLSKRFSCLLCTEHRLKYLLRRPSFHRGMRSRGLLKSWYDFLLWSKVKLQIKGKFFVHKETALILNNDLLVGSRKN